MEDLEFNPATAHNLLTPEGHKRMRAELDSLTTVKRAEIAERLRDCMDHGEFSEDNSELDEVKFEQAIVENRISDLKTILSSAHVIDENQIPTEKVGFGSYVAVKDADRKVEFEIRLVSSFEANPDDDLISNESPMGVALMGAAKGETVVFEAPAGKIRYEIVNIHR